MSLTIQPNEESPSLAGRALGDVVNIVEQHEFLTASCELLEPNAHEILQDGKQP